ncbi:N-acetylneuraminate epimerase [compost metagenome]
MNLVSVDGKVYAFAGGINYDTTMTRAIYEYDASSDSWTKKNDFKTATSSSAAVVHNGEIYILGGFIDKNARTSRVEVYNPEKNEVREFQGLTFARYQSVAATVNGELFIIGGTDGKVTLSTVQKYSLVREDPTNPEQPTPEQPTPEQPEQPEQPSGNRAILVVTMTTGLEKEFDLSMKEVNAFISWYEAKQAGSGKASYAINKHDNNKGPFNSRKDYILYDRVLTFEVSEY